MSIGSETRGGISAVEVSDLTIDGADNGIRIKSNRTRGGLVQDVAYRDICIRDVKNPIIMETTYEHKTEGDLIPEFKDILLQDVRIYGGGKMSLDGTDAAHPLQMRFDGVKLSDVLPRNIHATRANCYRPRKSEFCTRWVRMFRSPRSEAIAKYHPSTLASCPWIIVSPALATRGRS